MPTRLDPDELLKQIVKLSAGRHRIYIGMAPGVGKTFRMLEDANELRKKDIDIVIGYIEMQSRPENDFLINQFEIIPKKVYKVNNNEFYDLDLEAIIERKPASVIIDELAHSNVPGSLNQKRYEDVQELLKKGISVFSTMNVHQIVSIATIVEKQLGVQINETVPDWVINQVDEIIVVDLPLEELYERLENKKIYSEVQLKHALKNFFKRNNLLLLRDLALNFLAEKVDTQLISEKLKAKIKERILVSASPKTTSLRLIRHAGQIAKAFHADVDVICILKEKDQDKDEMINKLREETKIINGNFVLLKNSTNQVFEELIHYIQSNRTTILILGYPKRPKWKDLIFGSTALKVLNALDNIDILIVSEKDTLPETETKIEVKQNKLENLNIGKLKIYIGMAPGVGKTYKMLQEARELHNKKANILLGAIEPHGRIETAKLMEGLPSLPAKLIKHQGKYIQEFDLEAAILRKPDIIFVDELAHSNVTGAINNKRYQDVQYLLRAGINVVSTVNIQHIESLNDIVEQFSGIQVRETVPDWIFSHANEIVLVDISPEALQERLKEGKVYSLDRIEQAMTHFFQRKNLIALRELSLREVAENVEHELYPKEKLMKVLSLVDINEDTLRLIRKSARIANRLQSELIVTNVVKDTAKLLDVRKMSIIELEELVVELGGDFRLIEGRDVIKEIINAEKKIKPEYIIIGEPKQKNIPALLKKSIIREILNKVSDTNTWIVGHYTKEAESL